MQRKELEEEEKEMKVGRMRYSPLGVSQYPASYKRWGIKERLGLPNETDGSRKRKLSKERNCTRIIKLKKEKQKPGEKSSATLGPS